MSKDKPETELAEVHYEAGIPILPTPTDEAEAQRHAKESREATNKDKQVSVNNRIAFFTGALVLCTLITAGIGGWQAWVSEEAANTSMKSVLIAQRAERASEKSSDEQSRQSALTLKNSIDSFHLEQRAWIEVVPEISKPLPPVEGMNMPPLWDYRFAIKNTGKTAARIINVSDNNRSVPNGKDTKIGIEEYQKKFMLSRPAPAILVPGSDLPWVLRGIMERNSTMSNGGLLLHQYLGRIDYKDVFGSRHWLTFCYQLHDDATPALCEFGNDQDTKK